CRTSLLCTATRLTGPRTGKPTNQTIVSGCRPRWKRVRSCPSDRSATAPARSCWCPPPMGTRPATSSGATPIYGGHSCRRSPCASGCRSMVCSPETAARRGRSSTDGCHVRIVRLVRHLGVATAGVLRRAATLDHPDHRRQFLGLDQHVTGLGPLGGPDDVPGLHQVHEATRLGEPDPQLALQHRGRSEL